MFITYPVIIYKCKNESGYVALIPDLDNGATQGETIEETYKMAQDYIASWLYDDYINNKELPKSSDLNKMKIENLPYYNKDKSIITLVGVNMEEKIKINNKKSVRKTLTIPSYLNEMAKSQNINFSKLLQESLKKELNIR